MSDATRPPDPDAPRDPAASGGRDDADAAPVPAGGSDAHDAAGGKECACCTPREVSEEEMASTLADPAGRSLSQALGVSFLLLKLVMVGVVALFLIDRVRFVDQGAVGLKKRLGAYVREADGSLRLYRPGELIFLWPEPIESLTVIPSQTEKSLLLDQAFWPAPSPMPRFEGADELPESETLHPNRDGYNLTGDNNIIHTRWRVLYRITDPERYVLSVAARPPATGAALAGQASLTPEDMLRRVAQSVIFARVAGVPVDDVFGEENRQLFNRIVAEVREALLDETGRPRWGVEVTAVANERVLPPGKTQAAFNAVSTALSARKSREDAARAEARTLRNDAEKEANRIRNEGHAYARRIVRRAEADAQRLRDLLAQYPGDPTGLAVYLHQVHQEVLRSVLEGTDRYLLRPGQTWFMTGPLPELFLSEDEEASP